MVAARQHCTIFSKLSTFIDKWQGARATEARASAARASQLRPQTPSVVELCQAVITAQTPEIEQMQAWLLEWYNIEYAVMSMSPTAATEPSGASDDPMSAMVGHMDHMSDMMSGMADHMGHMDQMGDMMSRMGDMMSQMSTMMSQMGDMMGMMAGMGATDPAAGTDHTSHGSTDTSTDHSNHGSRDTSTDHSGHTAAGPHSDPAMMMGMFAGFNRLEGVEYEIAWLESISIITMMPST